MASEAGKRQRGTSLMRMIGLAGAALLGACSTIVPRTAPPPVERPAAPPPRTARPAPVEPGIPTDTQHNRVALLVPLSGPNAGVGQSLANATMLALLDARSDTIRITNYDTSRGAAAAARQALAEGNKLILGPLLSENVRAVAPIAHAANVPVISFSNDVDVAGNGAYVMGYSPAQSIERVVAYAHDRGLSNYGALVPNGLYGERASTAFLRAVEDEDGQVVSLQTYDRSGSSLSGAVTRMARNSPYDAVLLADSGATAAAAVPLLRKAGSGAQILGTELWNAESSIAAKPALNGAWFASVSDVLYRQYAAKYRARFGTAPYRLSSLGYDAVLLTIRIARDWPVGRTFPEDRLTDSGGFSGIDGAFRFGRDGVAQRALEVQEIRGGQTITVSPAPREFGH